jgi:hypothetical protein
MSGFGDKKDAAERDDNGDLVYIKEIEHPAGHTETRETNLSKLLNPGQRKTGDVNILLHEARQHAEGGVDNPAYPIDRETLNEAVPKIKDEGLEPAWKHHDPEEDYI